MGEHMARVFLFKGYHSRQGQTPSRDGRLGRVSERERRHNRWLNLAGASRKCPYLAITCKLRPITGQQEMGLRAEAHPRPLESTSVATEEPKDRQAHFLESGLCSWQHIGARTHCEGMDQTKTPVPIRSAGCRCCLMCWSMPVGVQGSSCQKVEHAALNCPWYQNCLNLTALERPVARMLAYKFCTAIL